MKLFVIFDKASTGRALAGWVAAGLTAAVSATQPGAASLNALAARPLYFESSGTEGGAQEFVTRGRQHEFVLRQGGADLFLFGGCGPDLSTARSRGAFSAVHASSAGVIHLDFPGSDTRAPLAGEELLPGRVNYLVGAEFGGWRTQLPIYQRVSVRELYPGIALVYYGNQQELEYDFTVAAGADPALVRMRFTGADHVRVNDDGELVLELEGAEIRHHRPVIYQPADGKRLPVTGGYEMMDSQTVAFWLGDYDRGLPLVIDPILSYSSYFGGNAGDLALSVKVDAAGSIYVAGQTLSKRFNFPISTNVFQRSFRGGSINGDGFVAKFDSTGSNLVYFTYLGGKANDGILDLAIDSEGNAYVTGFTASPDFPVRNALWPKIHGAPDPTVNVYRNDAFVAELNPSGSGLVYSTYIGGGADDLGAGIAVDPTGSAFIAGYTRSSSFPLRNPLPGKGNLGGNVDAFAVRLAPQGTNLVYSLYLGGSKGDEGQGIAVDDLGFAYITGYTKSKNFPITNAFQSQINGTNATAGVSDAFITKLDPAGALVYSSYIGWGSADSGFRVALDRERNAFVTGYTQSRNFPVTVTNIPALNQVTNADKLSQGFLVKVGTDSVVGSQTNGLGVVRDFTNDVASVRYSAAFGGTRDDVAWDVAVDDRGDAFVAGITLSTNFPVFNAAGALNATRSGKKDAFLIAFNADASALLYSGFLGGASNDFAYGIAVSAGGDAYVVGRTTSTNFPLTGAAQSTKDGNNDAFVAIVTLEPALQQRMTDRGMQLRWWAGTPPRPEYLIESTDGSSDLWSPVPQVPQVTHGWASLQVPRNEPVRFFRLHRRTVGHASE